MTKPPVKLSGVPNRSGPIWWQTVQETPSAASRSSGAPEAPIGRCAKMAPCPPAACASVRDIGMWQIEHSSSIARPDSG